MALGVVDLKELEAEKEKLKKKKKEEEEIKQDPQDLLWAEIVKCMDKLSKGVEGDLSSLGRAVRTINRFRLRFTNVTWCRIVYFLIPPTERNEFINLLSPLYPEWKNTIIQTVRRLGGVTLEKANKALDDKNGNVLEAVLTLIAEKERIAAQQLKKEQIEKEEKMKEELNKSDKTRLKSPKSTDSQAAEQAPSKDEGQDQDVEMADKDKQKDIDSEIKAAIEEFGVNFLPLKDQKRVRQFYPETSMFMGVLIALEFFDRDEFQQCLKILEGLIIFAKTQNRRTCDLLSARVYQFYSLCHQRLGQLTSIRKRLYSEYRTACLQQNEPAQGTLINLILQNYLSEGLYALARKFAQKAEFVDSSESSQFARYHYFRGRIDCVQLRYEDALYHMQQAIRRAPQSGAIGFKLTSTKWLIVIHLLMGDIPDRALFSSFDEKENREKLEPYLEITESVRTGNVGRFLETIKKNHKIFKDDALFIVLQRLRHNVIKTGLRKINKSYSRISLQNICEKLLLESVEDAYDIVAKAIRDGVIDATIDLPTKTVQSREVSDIYSTDLPYQQLATRVRFCLDIHTQAVKALRYPPNEELKREDDAFDHDAQAAQDIADAIREAFEEDEN